MASLGVSSGVSAQHVSFKPPVLDLAKPEAELDRRRRPCCGTREGFQRESPQNYGETSIMAEHQRKDMDGSLKTNA